MDTKNKESYSMIGTDLVHRYLSLNEKISSIQENDSENISSNDNASINSADRINASLIGLLICRARNLLHSTTKKHEIIDMNFNKYRYANRMILLGPSKSGKSSLAMDCACSICSFTTSLSTELQVNSKRVTYLMHSSQREHNEFPIKCEQNNKYDDVDNGIGVSVKEKRLAIMKKIFQKIDIHYVSTIDDLIRFLSIIPLLPLDKQPSGGIIFDDLHLFFIHHNTNSNVIDDDMMMKLLQLLALIASSANYLDNNQSKNAIPLKHESTFIVITWNTSIIALPKHMQQIISNYIPYFAIIHQDRSDDAKQNKIEHKSASRWRVYLQYHRGSEHDLNSVPTEDSTSNNSIIASYQIYLSDGNESQFVKSCSDNNGDDNILIWTVN